MVRKRGEPANDAAVRAIANALDIPVQLGGGVSLDRTR
jgi:phosphoribosylformimino-5-aminoimidazole carboxamide ribotide isomerase